MSPKGHKDFSLNSSIASINQRNPSSSPSPVVDPQLVFVPTRFWLFHAADEEQRSIRERRFAPGRRLTRPIGRAHTLLRKMVLRNPF